MVAKDKEFKWSDIKRDDVLKAIEIFRSEKPEYPRSQNTFLLYEGNKLPAKHIRGMAYKVAFGKEIGKDQYSGGMETVKFFERLDFEIHYIGKKVHTKANNMRNKRSQDHEEKMRDNATQEEVIQKPLPEKKPESVKKIKVPSGSVIEQKNKMQLLLNEMFKGDVVCEKTFPWLKTPIVLDGIYKTLFDALSEYRGDTTFAKKGYQLKCDFVCESNKLIIEYDERQHFSKARRISLSSYSEIPVYYDKKMWIQACEDINAKDNHPFNRDESRAYYDSVRDIEAYKNGYKLIRIMHGQVDFESENADEKLKEILNVPEEIETDKTNQNKKGLRVGLYLQTDELKNKASFDKVARVVKKSDFDIFVLSEYSYFPKVQILQKSDIGISNDVNLIYDACLELSNEIKKAVVVSSVDRYGRIFSVFANAFADDVETKNALYIKHTMKPNSAFDIENYHELSKTMFEPILFKDYRIGMTICYDCNHALFSRIYGINGVDLLINSTGGDVIYDKWHKYNKVRAIENQCYNFVTMGGDGYVKNSKAYVYGFNPNGKDLKPHNLMNETEKLNSPEGVYIYDTLKDDGGSSIDSSLYQSETFNNDIHFEVPVGGVEQILKQSKKVTDSIFIYKVKDKNVVFCMVNGHDILKPEKVLKLLYADELKEIANKRYIIVNKHEHIDEDLFNTKPSIVFKVRSMENFCAVIVQSDHINKCYQCGMNRTAQVVKQKNGQFGIDLSRTTGPEAIWKNKGMSMKPAGVENMSG